MPAVGMKLSDVGFRSIAGCDEAGLFDAFDLGHAAIMDGDLNRAETEVCDIPPNHIKPIGFRTVR